VRIFFGFQIKPNKPNQDNRINQTAGNKVKRKLLDVGQCNADHSQISATLGKFFDVEIQRAHSHEQAIKLAADAHFDLIMINRLLDADGSPGMDILRSLKTTPATAGIPVMIVSNFEDAQKAAVDAGAVTGFGKAALAKQETKELLAQYLT
jgi:CheY-like chemotaxis protein